MGVRVEEALRVSRMALRPCGRPRRHRLQVATAVVPVAVAGGTNGAGTATLDPWTWWPYDIGH